MWSIPPVKQMQKIHLFKQLIFNSTIIQYNQHALPHITFMFHRWELWINYLQFYGTSSCDCSWWVRRRGWIYVAAHEGKRDRGRVVVWCRRVCSDGCVEVRMSAVRWSQHWWQHHHNDGSYLVRERSKGQVSFLWELQQCHTHSFTHTHLDCGSASVLSFNSSSETSVSRISGLDLFPYLRHRKRDRQMVI